MANMLKWMKSTFTADASYKFELAKFYFKVAANLYILA